MNQYIVFFWGNPGTGGARKLVTYVSGAVSGVGFERARNNEMRYVNRETDRAMREKRENGITWKDAAEYNKDKEETRQDIIRAETTILHFEEKTKEVYNIVKETFTDK